MQKIHLRLAACALSASFIALPAIAQAGSGGTITHNNATFTQGDVTTDPNGSGTGGTNFTVGGAGNPDHLFQSWWWYRTQNDSREFALANADSWSWVGRVGEINFTTASATFDLTYLVTGLGDGSGALTETLTVRNTTNEQLRVDLFSYIDIDLGGTASSDSAVLNGGNSMFVSDGPWQAAWEGSGRYEVTSFAGLRGQLSDGAVTNFANGGLPFGPGDFTGGWQWTISLAPGQSASFTTGLRVAIPAPGAIALLGVAGLLSRRRRRTNVGRTVLPLTACALAAAVVATPALAQAGSGGTITHNNASFTQGDVTTDPNGTGTTGANFTVGGPGNPNHLFQTWWWYRTQNDSREFALANANAWSWAGRVGELDFSTASASFNLTYLVSGFGDGHGVLTETLTVLNTSNEQLRLELFNYLDADLGGSASSDSAFLNGGNSIIITDGPWQASYEGSGRYEVTSFAGLRGQLSDGAVTNFANGGLPFGPGDFTGGWQWSLSLAPGQGAIVTSSFTVSLIPAPGAIALLGVAGVITRRRRRNN